MLMSNLNISNYYEQNISCDDCDDCYEIHEGKCIKRTETDYYVVGIEYLDLIIHHTIISF